MEKSLKQRVLDENPDERRVRVDALNGEARERWSAAYAATSALNLPLIDI